MNCISRLDKGKNLFVQENSRKIRWNLYSQIAIENNMLICAKEAYNLTDICYFQTAHSESRLCTLLDTNEVVDIGIYM